MYGYSLDTVSVYVTLCFQSPAELNPSAHPWMVLHYSYHYFGFVCYRLPYRETIADQTVIVLLLEFQLIKIWQELGLGHRLRVCILYVYVSGTPSSLHDYEACLSFVSSQLKHTLLYLLAQLLPQPHLCGQEQLNPSAILPWPMEQPHKWGYSSHITQLTFSE